VTVACHCRWHYCLKSIANVNLPVLALATLGGSTQIGSFLLAKASEEGDIGVIIASVMELNMAIGNTD
jgi:hypothetical protein